MKDDTATFSVEMKIFSSRGGSDAVTRNYSVTDEVLDNVKLSIDGKIVHSNKVCKLTFLVSRNVSVLQYHLSGHSNFFRTLFFGDFKEKGEEICELKDVKYDDFIELLRVRS